MGCSWRLGLLPMSLCWTRSAPDLDEETWCGAVVVQDLGRVVESAWPSETLVHSHWKRGVSCSNWASEHSRAMPLTLSQRRMIHILMDDRR